VRARAGRRLARDRRFRAQFLTAPSGPDGARVVTARGFWRRARRNMHRRCGFAMLGAMSARLKALLQWWRGTRIARMLARYGVSNGAMLSGGVAFSALFSIFAALVIGFTVFTM